MTEHFVTLLVLGNRPGRAAWSGEPVVESEPTSMADARMIASLNTETLQCCPSRELRNLTIIVICDLSRVEVTGIAVGTDYLTFEGPSSPVAFARGCQAGVLVRAFVRPRASEK